LGSEKGKQKIDVERFNLKKLSAFQISKQYQFKISNMFTAFENLIGYENINGVGKNTKECIKTSVKESLFLYEWNCINQGLVKNV